MAVNVRSVFLGCKYALPIMRRQGGGVIVNTASVAGMVGVKDLAAYSASNAAVVGRTIRERSLSKVLFPDPFRPITHTTSPVATSNEISRRAQMLLSSGVSTP